MLCDCGDNVDVPPRFVVIDAIAENAPRPERETTISEILISAF
jgi:hypothetical protein